MKKILTIFVLGLFLASVMAVYAADLEDYPLFFKKAGQYGIIVVGDGATAMDTIAATDIQVSLPGFPIANTKLASEVTSLNQNIISVGNPCKNAITASIMGITDCAGGLEEGQAMIKLYKRNNYYHLVVFGTSGKDTLEAASRLVAKSGLAGQELIIKSHIAEPEPEPEPRKVMDSAANQASCGVPVEFRDRMDIGLIYLGDKHAHGKGYGHLGLEGAYWVESKAIQGKTATIDVDGVSGTLSEGQNKEINGLVIYLYKVGEDYIDYCIHETKAQYLKLTCAGCITDSKCLAQGMRIVVDGIPSYCSIDNVLVGQEGEGTMCQNNYECESNLCIDSECISPGLIKRIILWFKNLFG